MKNKYGDDVRRFIQNHLSTSSAARVTTIAEFNRDGQYMVDQKQIYYDQLQRSQTSGSDRDYWEAQLIMLFMQSENKRLRLKHWPNSQNT